MDAGVKQEAVDACTETNAPQMVAARSNKKAGEKREKLYPRSTHLRPVEDLVHLRDRVAAEGGNVPAGHDGVLQPRMPGQALGEQRLSGPRGACVS